MIRMSPQIFILSFSGLTDPSLALVALLQHLSQPLSYFSFFFFKASHSIFTHPVSTNIREHEVRLHWSVYITAPTSLPASLPPHPTTPSASQPNRPADAEFPGLGSGNCRSKGGGGGGGGGGWKLREGCIALDTIIKHTVKCAHAFLCDQANCLDVSYQDQVWEKLENQKYKRRTDMVLGLFRSSFLSSSLHPALFLLSFLPWSTLHEFWHTAAGSWLFEQNVQYRSGVPTSDSGCVKGSSSIVGEQRCIAQSDYPNIRSVALPGGMGYTQRVVCNYINR